MLKHRQLAVSDQNSQRRDCKALVFSGGFLIGHPERGQVEGVDLILRKIFVAKGYDLAEEIVIDIVAVNQVVIIADDAQLAGYLDGCAQLFLQLPLYCGLQVLPGLDSAARCFNQRCTAEHVVTLDADKVEVHVFVVDYGPCYLPVVVCELIRPLIVFKFNLKFI